jgi:hypothetical protein
MPAMIERDFTNLGNVALAYLLAVTSASLSFTLLLEASAIIHSRGFETATTNSVPTKALHLLIMTILIFVIGWFFALVTTFVPFVIGIATARWLKFTHWAYFVAGATITAVALSPLYIFIPNLGINVQEPEPSFLEKFWSSLPFFLASGALAGTACSRYLRRASGEK